MPDQDQNSMLKVICNQRDRFRSRLRETEEVWHQMLNNSLFSYINYSVFNLFILPYLGSKTFEGENRVVNSRTGENEGRQC